MVIKGYRDGGEKRTGGADEENVAERQTDTFELCFVMTPPFP